MLIKRFLPTLTLSPYLIAMGLAHAGTVTTTVTPFSTTSTTYTVQTTFVAYTGPD
jgi:hypothetical protein